MLGIELDRNSRIALAHQIYRAIRIAAMDGRLQAGQKLISTRAAAKQFGVSRNTVCEAYEMLMAEGYIETRQGSQTKIAEGLLLKNRSTGASLSAFSPAASDILKADFKTGQPDIHHFPMKPWIKLMKKTSEDMPTNYWGYSAPEGLPELRQEIAGWLCRSRGMNVCPEDLFITAGATQALNLLTELLYSPGKSIVVEDPCHLGMLKVIQSKGYTVLPVPVDAHGLIAEAIPKTDFGAIYVTPSHQFPLGVIMSAARRTALIRIAQEKDAVIIEDDYDSDFRYSGHPIAPLYTLDPERVAYVGTFSKSMYPAIRIGYVVLPRRFHRRWHFLRMYADVQNSPAEQMALAVYLHSQKFDRHIQKMRNLYGQRRHHLVEAAGSTFSCEWQPWGDASGLHLSLAFPGKQFDGEFVRRCKAAGIRLAAVSQHSIENTAHNDKLVVGYGHLELTDIHNGIRLMNAVLSDNQALIRA